MCQWSDKASNNNFPMIKMITPSICKNTNQTLLLFDNVIVSPITADSCRTIYENIYRFQIWSLVVSNIDDMSSKCKEKHKYKEKQVWLTQNKNLVRLYVQACRAVTHTCICLYAASLCKHIMLCLKNAFWFLKQIRAYSFSIRGRFCD